MFVHHFETVAGSLPNCSANHLLERYFQQALPLFCLCLLFLPFYDIIMRAKLHKKTRISMKVRNKIAFCSFFRDFQAFRVRLYHP